MREELYNDIIMVKDRNNELIRRPTIDYVVKQSGATIKQACKAIEFTSSIDKALIRLEDLKNIEETTNVDRAINNLNISKK